MFRRSALHFRPVAVVPRGMRLWIELSALSLFVNPETAWCVSDFSADGASVQVTTDLYKTPFKVLDLTGRFQMPEYVVFYGIHEQYAKQLNIFETGFYALEYVDMQQVHQRLSDCLTVLHHLPAPITVIERNELRIFGTLHPDVYVNYIDWASVKLETPCILIDISNNVILLHNAPDVDIRGMIEASNNFLRNPV